MDGVSSATMVSQPPHRDEEEVTHDDHHRGRSRFGRLYKRRGCTTCVKCNHGDVDALGDKLTEMLKLSEAVAPAPAPAAPFPAAPVPAAAETDVEEEKSTRRSTRTAPPKKASEEKVSKKGGKATPAATLVRAPLTPKAGNEEDNTAKNVTTIPTKASREKKQANDGKENAASIPMKAASREKKQANDGKENGSIPAKASREKKQANDAKENVPRASSRKQRSLKEIQFFQS